MKKVLCASLAVLLAAGCSSSGSGSAANETKSEDAYYVFTTDVQTLDWQMSNVCTSVVNT